LKTAPLVESRAAGTRGANPAKKKRRPWRILDGFTGTRQRRYQLRHAQRGLCSHCAQKAVLRGCCLFHAVQVYLRVRRQKGITGAPYNCKLVRLLAEKKLLHLLEPSKPSRPKR
jgi:hypothetical protein